MRERSVRVLIADDSATSRLALRTLLSKCVGITVVGEVVSGVEAVREAVRLRPDIVLMDLQMSRMDGLEATRRLMREAPAPVLLVSEHSSTFSELGFRVLEAGALEIVAKPSRRDVEDPHFCSRFCRLVRTLSAVPVVTRTRSAADERESEEPPPRGVSPQSIVSPKPMAPPEGRYARLCIGASTGGPPALRELLLSFEGHPPWPVLIVQHITAGFAGSMVSWLAEETGLTVMEASHGVVPKSGVVYVAPDGAHLALSGSAIALTGEPRTMHRPSVDVLFRSVAASRQASSTLAVLLTGMGSDGAAGLLALREGGAWTIAQDEATSVVFGMPLAAIELGAAIETLPLGLIGPRLLALSG